jgi:hypothetical protein
MMSDDILVKAGKTIISSFFVRNEQHSMDDAELLPIVKDVVSGMSAHSTDAATVKETLFKFAQKKYTDLCKKNQIKNDDDEDRLQENREYFEYVYENEEHPR